MNTTSLIIASVCGLFALALLAFFLRVLLAPLMAPLRGALSNASLKRRKIKKQLLGIAEFDRELNQRHYESAFQMLCAAVVFEDKIPSLELLRDIGAHHIAINNKLLLLADLQDASLPQVANLERLFELRLKYLRQQMELLPSNKNPHLSWADGEIAKKAALINDQLTRNELEIKAEFEGAWKILNTTDTDSPPTYH